MSLTWSPFTGDGPEEQSEVMRLKQTPFNLKRPTPTSLLTPAAAQVIPVGGSLLELLDLLSHGHVDRLLLHLPLAALRQVEGFGHCGTTRRPGLKRKTGGVTRAQLNQGTAVELDS